MVRAEGSRSRGRGFEYRRIWMDVSYFIFNEKGNKGSQMGHTKKKIFKKNI